MTTSTLPPSTPSPATETMVSLAASIPRCAQLLILITAVVLHGVSLFHAKPLQSANDRSRWCTIWSLINRGTFQIDEIRQHPGWNTIDLVYVSDHFYSTKPPLFTTLVAGVTWCVQKLTGWDLLSHTHSVTFTVLLLTNLLPFAISLVAWMGLLERLSTNSWTRLFGLSFAAFGTLLTPFLMSLNNHTIAAAAIMVALLALVRLLEIDDVQIRWQYALAGFMLAWATTCELPAAAFAGLGFLLALQRSVRKTLIYFLPAALIPLLAMLVTNFIATGGWKPFYAEYGTEKYRFLIDGVPSYWMEPHGVDTNRDGPLIYFLHCTIGHHGILSLTPVLVFSLVGWLGWLRVTTGSLARLMWAGLVTTIVVLAFYLSRTQNYNYGGVSCGLRWALWLIPLWLIAALPVLDRWSSSVVFRTTATFLFAVSMVSAWLPVPNPWQQPWIFEWMESRGWIDYSDPVPTLPKPLWTWIASLPETTTDGPAWIEFQVDQPCSEPKIIRMTLRPDRQHLDRADLVVEQTACGDPQWRETRTLQLDVAEFERGASPADVLHWSNPAVTPAEQQADLAFLRGLPLKTPFQARVIRYLKSPLRAEALRCTVAVGHLRATLPESTGERSFRCETWLSDDVPFGVAQVEFHIAQSDNGSVIFHERWTVRACHPDVKPFRRIDSSAEELHAPQK